MADISRIEPTQLPNGLWLDGNEYASENVEESSGVLSLVSGETDGYRVGPELDVGAISDVASSKLEWDSTGDVEVLAAVSEVSAQGSMRGDGVDDYINLGTLGSTGSEIETKGLQVSFWIKTTQTARRFVTGGILVDGDSMLFVPIINDSGADNLMSFYFRPHLLDGNRSTSIFEPNVTINDNQWHYVECGVSVGVTQFTMFLRVDGNEVADTASLASADFQYDFTLFAGNSRGTVGNWFLGNLYDFELKNSDGVIVRLPLDDPPGSETARDISGNNNNGAVIGATFDPNNPKQDIATNGQAMPGISRGDDLTGKKLYTQQRFNRDTTGDPSPTLTSLTAEVNGTGGAFSLINGGLIRSAHTQSNTMIR